MILKKIITEFEQALYDVLMEDIAVLLLKKMMPSHLTTKEDLTTLYTYLTKHNVILN